MARTIAKDHDQKRAHILRTAARVFSEEGIERASMSMIARECGISKANIYHYYEGKDALLFDILDAYLSALWARIEAIPRNGPPEAHLQTLLSEFLLAYEGMDHEHKIQTEGLPRLPRTQQDILRGHQRKMVLLMQDAIRAVSPQTFDNDPAKLRDTAMSVFGMLNWFYMWNKDATRDRRIEYAHLVTRLCTEGISAV